MNLELQLSAFFGYGKVAEDAYLGLQCHGVLWPAVTAEAPVHWPIAPPIVSGKARPLYHHSWHSKRSQIASTGRAMQASEQIGCVCERVVAGTRRWRPVAKMQSAIPP